MLCRDKIHKKNLNKNNIVAINHQCAKWIKINVVTIFYFTSVAKKLAVVERIFRQLGTSFSGCCRCREVKQESTYGLSAGTKKSSHCREVAVGAGSIVGRNKMPV